jgi:hypothetical protein
MTATQTLPQQRQTVLADRFITSEIDAPNGTLRDRLQLVFPALWVAEIVRIDRSQILELPFYDPLMAGIIHHNGRVIPLVNAARMLKVERHLSRECSIAIVLNEAAGAIANMGIVVDRAIGSSNKDDLPPALFDPAISRTATIQMMHPNLIPRHIWQPISG